MCEKTGYLKTTIRKQFATLISIYCIYLKAPKLPWKYSKTQVLKKFSACSKCNLHSQIPIYVYSYTFRNTEVLLYSFPIQRRKRYVMTLSIRKKNRDPIARIRPLLLVLLTRLPQDKHHKSLSPRLCLLSMEE